jgi:hypothetical protein
MTPDRFRLLLDRLGLNQSPLPGNDDPATSAPLFLRVDEANVRKWARGKKEIPHAVALLLEIMTRYGIRPSDIVAIDFDDPDAEF